VACIFLYISKNGNYALESITFFSDAIAEVWKNAGFCLQPHPSENASLAEML